jgi:hypothetical protein
MKTEEIEKKIFFLYEGNLSVSLGDTLDFILLLDGVRVGRTLGGVDELIGEALGHGLEVAEGGFAGTLAHEVDGLIDTAERGDVDGLATDDTTGTDTGRVFAGSTLGDGVNDDLDGVGGVLGGEVSDLEGVADDADSEELLAVGAHFEHEAVDEALNDGALDLTELLLLEATRRVGNEDGVDGDVVGEGSIVDLDVIEGPLSEKLGGLEGHLFLFLKVFFFLCLKKDENVFL